MIISDLLDQLTEERNDKTFIFCDDQEYGYKTIRDRGAWIAANLARRGVGKGDKIILLMGNCMEFVYLFLGVGRIGAVIVPVNPMLKPEEIAYIATNADATTLIMLPDFVPLLPVLRQMAPTLRHVFVMGDKSAEGTEPFSALLEPVAEIPKADVTEQDDAALIYTSGTTGAPKGVILTHRNYIWNARMVLRSTILQPTDRFLCVLPMFHVNAQVVTLLVPLMGGADLVLMTKFNALGILPMIAKYKISIMSAVPTIYAILCANPKAGEYDIRSMRFFVSGAAPMPEDTYLATQRVLKTPLIQGYGLSEATCASAVADHMDPIRWNSCGPALRYTRIRIVDSSGKDVPTGAIGEILVSGPTVMKGYYKNPEATAEVLKDGWLSTGDLGRFDEEGYLYIVGRLKDMIIRGGQNIYPAQIEGVLLRMEGIAEAAVIGVDEPRWGQEVLAVVKLAEGAELTEKEIIAFCREHLAPYKCPRYVRFVPELPKTATGKIKKNILAEQFADVAKG
ncbi:MAG TPA: long-chain-fatty-acid--CoA ligase [Candidatus Hydrogenedentes bacterium]|nr:long-chain-fatty-acid--CoA ligase [Candidatus Hydrogenedentota bacterium]HPC15750.1 long-chain-fatty-acid--CoA ligase [Candidatus Hydrogenedentota bacterium]HRT19626.1 long-chain-fatty-acid--CoA ligase [Candidatus Hydrogenedentota bacterium]HRT64401.1 long-chain-fatty-acid--CoA ligase [Candidatus Hydrogenedentota bacterium]